MHYLIPIIGVLYFHYILGMLIGFLTFLLLFLIFGIETGVHRRYVQLLLKTFEFCRQTIEKKKYKKRLEHAANGIVKSPSSGYLCSSEDENPSSSVTPDGDSDEESSQPQTRLTRILSMHENAEEPRDFQLSDIFDFIQKGVNDIVDDEVTKRFAAEELQCWNLLTRTNKNYHTSSWRLLTYYTIGFCIRFYILLPIRFTIFICGMIFFMISTSLIGLMPDSKLKRGIYNHASITAFRILGRSVSAVVTYHNEEHKPKNGGICVANHTSPFDVVMLHCDNAYALVGQLQGGYLGLMERGLNKAASHVFFDRFEMTDRMAVTRRLQAHVNDPNKLPILIFPEGTCINNSAVMMFKKGSFEVATTVYPVAIKYDPIFGDPFWNSAKDGYFTYILKMMTSWAIVCDVWYLPPMTKKEDESASEFANRVKSAIARRGSLVDLQWDGQLKRSNPRPEFKEEVQRKFSRKISVRSPASSPSLNSHQQPQQQQQQQQHIQTGSPGVDIQHNNTINNHNNSMMARTHSANHLLTAPS